MTALRQPDTIRFAPDEPARDDGTNAFLNHLRSVALGCRAKARSDMFQACALLAVDRTASIEALADALVLGLHEALPKRAIFFRPDTSERSFDEAWLVQLARAATYQDEASLAFLLHSRLPREHHRHIRFLVSRLSENFDLS